MNRPRIVNLDYGNRTAKDIIDDAVKENNFGAMLLYGFSTFFILIGLTILVFGAYNGETITSLIGLVASGLFWPAMSAARRTRKENIMIRLLAAPLSLSSTAEEAAEMLHRLANKTLSDRRNDG